MRLTLRTLLAYMDDILDPADHEDLGRKIESSPFATELIHRSRDSVRRLRLSAPDPMAGSDDDIHGGDHSLDANTAAEYLDNTLSAEAVAEFERSCLEAGANADMLLAEAASCHHVLTMVLGEPAEVDGDLRQRMYALAQSPAAAAQQLRIEPAHQALKQAPIVAAAGITAPAMGADAPPTSGTTAPPATVARTPRVEPDETGVPDYILAAARERRRGRRMLAGFATAVLLGGAATWFFWPGGEVETPKDLAAIGSVDSITEGPTVSGAEGPITTSSTGAAEGAAAMAPGGADSTAPAFDASATSVPTTPTGSVPADAESPALDAPSLGTPTLDPPALDAAPIVALPPEAPVEAAVASASGAPVVDAPVGEAPMVDPSAPGVVDAGAAEAGPAVAASSTPPAPPLTSGTPPAIPGGAGAVPPGAPGPIAAAASAPLVEDAPPVDDAAMAEADGLTPPAVADAAADAAEPKTIGAYLGNNDLLLMFDPAEKAWVRLPSRTALTGGEQLLALPTFRTHVVLADVNAYLSGGAQIDLIPPVEDTGDPAAEFALHIPYGQVVLNSGLNGNRVELSLVDQIRAVQLGPSSSLALEVRRIFEPGGAKREPAPAEVLWYLTSGTAQWGDTGSAEAPAMWTTIGGEDSAPAAVEELPEWVDHEPISPNELRARDRMADALVPGEAVNIHLLELSDPTNGGRRTEDRALAARSGAYVGLYDALVTALADVNQRAGWKGQIDSLRQAIARDPSSIEGIHAAFAIERGQAAADDLMVMLLGFDRAAVGTTREEVEQGALVRLLRWMDNDDLTYRVLAWSNANDILGTRDVGGYKPEQSASQRKRMLARLWEKLERGELMPPEVKAGG